MGTKLAAFFCRSTSTNHFFLIFDQVTGFNFPMEKLGELGKLIPIQTFSGSQLAWALGQRWAN